MWAALAGWPIAMSTSLSSSQRFGLWWVLCAPFSLIGHSCVVAQKPLPWPRGWRSVRLAVYTRMGKSAVCVQQGSPCSLHPTHLSHFVCTARATLQRSLSRGGKNPLSWLSVLHGERLQCAWKSKPCGVCPARVASAHRTVQPTNGCLSLPFAWLSLAGLILSRCGKNQPAIGQSEAVAPVWRTCWWATSGWGKHAACSWCSATLWCISVRRNVAARRPCVVVLLLLKLLPPALASLSVATAPDRP